jgi:hypothetical protein
MAKRLLAGAVLAAALGAVGTAAAGQTPIVRSLRVVHRHVVLELSVGDLRPLEFVVAKSRAVNANGALVRSNVILREMIQVPATTGVARWRSPHVFRPGTYFMQVEAIQTWDGGVADCPPKQPNCNVVWSSVRRVVVPK